MFSNFNTGLKSKYNPTLKLIDDFYCNGVHRLDPNLTINGVTQQPVFRYTGTDANSTTWAPWGYGETLYITGSGNDPHIGHSSPLLGPKDGSVLFNAGKCYQANNSDFAKIGLADMVFEMVCETPFNLAIDNTPISKYRSDSAYGWGMWKASIPTRMEFHVRASGKGITSTFSNVNPQTFYHFMGFGDRDGSIVLYYNGIASTPTSIATFSDQDLDTTASIKSIFTLGGTSRLNVPSIDSRICYATYWTGSAWLDTHLQPQIVYNRFYSLTGIKPSFAKGTYNPSIFMKQGTSSVDKTDSNGIRTLYKVGRDWPKIVERVDADNNRYRGLLLEASGTQYIEDTEIFSGSKWGSGNAIFSGSFTVSRNEVSPLGLSSSAHTITEDTSNGYHRLIGVGVAPVANTPYCFSIFAKSGQCNNIGMGFNKTGSLGLGSAGDNANFLGTFNLLSGTFISSGSAMDNVSWGIENWGNGWKRYWWSGRAAVSKYALDTRIALAMLDADNSEIYTGTNRTLVVFGMNFTQGSYALSNYVPSTGSVTISFDGGTHPSYDSLNYSGSLNIASNQTGSLTCKMITPSSSMTWGRSCIFSLHQSGNLATNNLSLLLTASSNFTLSGAATNGGNTLITGSTTITDGTIKNIRINWGSNTTNLKVNGVDQGTDTNSSAPASIDTFSLNKAGPVSSRDSQVVIYNLKIYSRKQS